MALLACVGVDEEGFREVLAVARTEKKAAYASLLRGLINRASRECVWWSQTTTKA